MSQVISLAELKTFAGSGVITDDVRGQQTVDAVNSHIESRTGRTWGETASGDEVHDYASVIFLNNMDIVTITELRINDTVLDPAHYKWRSTGRVVLSTREAGFNFRYDELEVSYIYGNLLVPDDLKQAALSVALDAYNSVEDGAQREVTEEQVGSLRYKYATGSNSSASQSAQSVINSYRRVSV